MLKAVKNYVVIKQDGVKDQADLLSSSIASEVKPNVGIVLSVGPGMRSMNGELIPMDIEAGDRVIFYNYAGVEIMHDNELFLLMPDSDIMCKVK